MLRGSLGVVVCGGRENFVQSICSGRGLLSVSEASIGRPPPSRPRSARVRGSGVLGRSGEGRPRARAPAAEGASRVARRRQDERGERGPAPPWSSDSSCRRRRRHPGPLVPAAADRSTTAGSMAASRPSLQTRAAQQRLSMMAAMWWLSKAWAPSRAAPRAPSSSDTRRHRATSTAGDSRQGVAPPAGGPLQPLARRLLSSHMAAASECGLAPTRARRGC